LANPPESIKSGHYGWSPRYTWWLKQCLIYFIGLILMKLFVYFLFAALPWLPWVGDWALRWTKGNQALEITFVMFVFPLIMNVIQYYIIDSFIMEKRTEDQEYERVHSQDQDEEERLVGEDDESSITQVEEEVGVKGKKQVESATLTEVNPTPVPADRREDDGK